MVAKTTAEAAADEAAAGVGARRTVASADTDLKRQDQITDVGADEAMQSAILDQTRSWNANVKRTYDTPEEELQTSVKSAQDHLNSVRAIREQMLTNMVGNADALNKQHLAHNNIAADRTWNVDEVSALVAKSGVQADALVALLLKATGEAVASSKK